MSTGLDNLKHIVVLMMENRSLDHMLGALKAHDARVDGLTGAETNVDTTGAHIPVQPLSDFQGQLDPDPDHHFQGVDLQIFGGQQGDGRQANMQGFIQSYYQQQRNINQSHGKRKAASSSGAERGRPEETLPQSLRPGRITE
jgi:phospholipase C